MKVNFKKALLASVLVAVSSASFAADTVDLKVTGKITPSACTPNFAGGNIVDFGNIAPNTLSLTADTLLAEMKATKLQITCEVPTRFAFTVNDMRSDSIPTQLDSLYSQSAGASIGSEEKFRFGLGKTTDGQTIGVFGMEMIKATSGSDVLNYLTRSVGGNSWAMQGGAAYQGISNLPEEYSFGANSEPDALSNVTVDINVNAIINDTTTMPVTDEITLDGLATFTLVYL